MLRSVLKYIKKHLQIMGPRAHEIFYLAGRLSKFNHAEKAVAWTEDKRNER